MLLTKEGRGRNEGFFWGEAGGGGVVVFFWGEVFGLGGEADKMKRKKESECEFLGSRWMERDRRCSVSC